MEGEDAGLGVFGYAYEELVEEETECGEGTDEGDVQF